MKHGLGTIHVLDEGLHATGEGETLLLAGALVHQQDLYAVVQEGQFTQAPCQDVVVIVDHAEDAARGEEMHLRAALLAGTGDTQRPGRRAIGELHLAHFAVAPDGEAQPAGERVHHRYTNAVQAAGDFVSVGVELAAGVQFGHHDLGGRTLQFVVFLDAGRNAAAVVQHRYRVVGMDGEYDFVAEPGQRLIDRVVHHLEHHVVQTGTVGSVPDVHAGALADRLETFKDFDAVGVVVVGVRRRLLCFTHV